MTDIIDFPTKRSIHTFDMRDVKRLTPQVALKSCMAELDKDTSDYLRSVVFGKWNLLREATENAAFLFTHFFPMENDKPLVVTAMKAAAEAYLNEDAKNILDRPTAYMDTLIRVLDQHNNWQPIGISSDKRRQLVWTGITIPVPVWLRRNELYMLEFAEHPHVPEETTSRGLILASKLLTEGGTALLDRIIAKRFRMKQGGGDE